MTFSINDVRFQYSGGAANSDPDASLGGVISSVRVPAQIISTPVNVTGVTINSANNNAQGVGLLAWSPGTNTLTWQPPGSAFVYSVVITADGVYVVGGSDGALAVTAVYASMAGVYKQDSLTVTLATGNVFDSVAPLDSLIGDIDYRCIYVKNFSDVTISDVRIWIKQLTTGPDEIDIGLDPAGAGDGSTTGVATVIADEGAAPAGVTFTRPLTFASGLVIGTLLAGQSAAFWERRTVPESTVGNVTANASTIAVALTV